MVTRQRRLLEEDDEGDLLHHLDVAHEREKWRARQQEARLHCKYVDLLRQGLGKAAADIPKRLINQYSAPPILQGLDKVLVSPRGVHYYSDDKDCPDAWLSICLDCDKSVRSQQLLKFAVANGFFIGALPKSMRALTLPERFMTQLASIGAMTRVMRGGRHRCIRSHCVAFDCTPGPPITLLPRSLGDVESYRVVMVGEFTEAQTKKIKKMHRIRNELVRNVFNFYKTYNHLYDNVFPNNDVLDSYYSDEMIAQQLVDYADDDDAYYDEAICAEQASIQGNSDTWHGCSSDEANVLERRTRFGQPALFVTLTPNTDESMVTAQYTGITSVEPLSDIPEKYAKEVGASRDKIRK
ncbi:unnamed protein product [Phytophthora lilii]|uniref:Unnamed protein product n=1 Tax=Phytophthora lilii TaxID=2077276 RepID=A0A9W6U5X5_9STRA|nr:unnamed protein product [Phytophthora lilii]